MSKLRAHFKSLSGFFILTCCLALTGLGGVLVYRQGPDSATNWLLSTDMKSQAELWRKRVLMQIDNGPDAFIEGRLTARDTGYLSEITRLTDFYRFKLFTADGTVFWSNRAAEIGRNNEEPYFQSIIAKGHIHLIRETKPLTEIDHLEWHSASDILEPERKVFEVYTPIMSGGRFVGAIEFYADKTSQFGIFKDIFQRTLTIGGAIIVAVVTALFGLFIQQSRQRVNALKQRAEEERRLMEDQVKLAREVRLLGELNEWLQSSRSLNELFIMVTRFMKHILPESEGALYVYSNSRDVLDGSASWNGGKCNNHIHPEACWGLRRGRAYHYGQSEVDFACEHTDPDEKTPYFCFPILALGETVGLMHLRKHPDATVKAFAYSRRLAQMCAEQISMAIANVRMRDELEDRSIRDPLTGLFNRRHMLERMRKLIARADGTALPLHMVYIDVDHFKKFNDNHGHDAGDMVLRAVGEVLIKHCDGDEVACRMGGEEFMLLLPDVSPDLLKARIEKLRREVSEITVRYGDKALPRITISSGIASYPQHGRIPQELLRVADNALYQAKDNGRNQVVFATLKNPGAATGGPSSPGLAAE